MNRSGESESDPSAVTRDTEMRETSSKRRSAQAPDVPRVGYGIDSSEYFTQDQTSLPVSNSGSHFPGQFEADECGPAYSMCPTGETHENPNPHTSKADVAIGAGTTKPVFQAGVKENKLGPESIGKQGEGKEEMKNIGGYGGGGTRGRSQESGVKGSPKQHSEKKDTGSQNLASSQETKGLEYLQLGPEDYGTLTPEAGHQPHHHQGRRSLPVDPETEELRHIHLGPNNFGTLTPKAGHQPHHHQGEKLKTPPSSPEQKYLGPEDIGGDIKSQYPMSFHGNPTPPASPERAKHSKGSGVGASPKVTKKGGISLETKELSYNTMTKDDFGYNIGGDGHTKYHPVPLSPETKELSPNHLRAEDIGAQHVKADLETRELRHISLRPGEIGANDPGRHEDPAHDPVCHGPSTIISPETEELSHNHLRREDIGPQHLKVDPESRELRHIKLRKNDYGTNSTVKHDDPSHAPIHGPPDTKSPETEELSHNHLRREDIGNQHLKADSETRELRHIRIVQKDIGTKDISRHEDPAHDPPQGRHGHHHRRRKSSLPADASPETKELFPNHLRAQDIGPQHIKMDAETRELRHNKLRKDGIGSNSTVRNEGFLYQRQDELLGGSGASGPSGQPSSQLLEGTSRTFPKTEPFRTEQANATDSGDSRNHVERGRKSPKLTVDDLDTALSEFEHFLTAALSSRASAQQQSHFPITDSSEIHSFSTNISQLGSRLCKLEKEVDFIKKQFALSVPSSPTISPGIQSLQPDSAPESETVIQGEVEIEFYRKGSYMSGSLVRWSIIGLFAISLVVLCGWIGEWRRYRNDIGGQVAQWLLREGRRGV